MKRVLTAILALVLVLALYGCGKTEAVKNVESMIDALGTVTAESLEAVNAAMDAYEALTDEEKETVSNYAALTAALDDCLELKLAGPWVYEPNYFYNVEEMYDKTDMTLNADMTATGEYTSGTWRVEENKLMINNGEYDVQYSIYQDGGKLRIGHVNSKMMPVEEFNALLDEMFVIVEVTPANVADYCKVTIYTEIEEDDFGVVTGDTRTYATLESTVYDDGLLFMDGSDDLAIELLIPEHAYQYKSGSRKWRTRTEEADEQVIKRTPYGSYGGSLGGKYVESEYETIHEITADQITFGRVMGKITFIKAEYVETVKKDDNGISRLLILKDGTEIHAGTWKEDLKY
nr:hypothetical protein [Oscillospiraceae bacterium]